MINTHNFCLITLDSLRYDVATMANTPNILKHSVDKQWHKVYAHGTYTLPSHVAMLQNGKLPDNNHENEKFPYNISKNAILRAPITDREKPTLFRTPPAINIVKGFEKAGYRTIGIGGVGWFDTTIETSAIWKNDYFQEFYWNHGFKEEFVDSFEKQIICYANQKNSNQKEFLFINVASTHFPYRNAPRKIESQVSALEYVDQKIETLFNLLPKPVFVVITADHGECFKEQDGVDGHSFYHPSVMTVPMTCFVIK